MQNLPQDTQKKLLPLKEEIVGQFTPENWNELGILTSSLDLIRNHPRLLRSLGFNDTDYAGHVLDVLIRIVGADDANFNVIQRYVEEKFGNGEVVSIGVPKGRRIVFSPAVFTVPECSPSPDLVSIMMPYRAEFKEVQEAIAKAVQSAHMQCQRADDIWEHSVVIQDVFSLIFRSNIVVCDFTGRNPNVFYEAGIAHTLGKHVVPIAQSTDDIPFDLTHHRYILYLNNAEGRLDLAPSDCNSFRA